MQRKRNFLQVVERVHHIINSNNGITGITDLLYRAMNAFDIFDKRLDSDLLDVIYETIGDLDDHSKKLFLYRMKMFAENNFENRLEKILAQNLTVKIMKNFVSA